MDIAPIPEEENGNETASSSDLENEFREMEDTFESSIVLNIDQMGRASMPAIPVEKINWLPATVSPVRFA